LNLYYGRHFERFKELAESTWSGLRIVDLEGKGGMPGDAELSLLVQDAGFVAEVGWMGHGLQIWLQLIWFLTRSSDPEIDPDEDTFIFDEPDVFMHADLQRKFIRVLRKFKQQVIIATHSTEMLAEVEPEQILIVDREKRRSNFATTPPSVQVVLNRIGSAHNIQLARLWSARRFQFWKHAVGVVTPHRAQQGLIISRLQQVFSHVPRTTPAMIHDAVDTVERFQGQQRDVIIASFSLGDPHAIGMEDEFLMSLNRFNVMASRARAKLIVLVTQEVVDHLSDDLITLRSSRLLKNYTKSFCRNYREMELGWVDGSSDRPVTGLFKYR
jgi:energy-coupling factor transporter ATP-binding protein EcfA2